MLGCVLAEMWCLLPSAALAPSQVHRRTLAGRFLLKTFFDCFGFERVIIFEGEW